MRHAFRCSARHSDALYTLLTEICRRWNGLRRVWAPPKDNLVNREWSATPSAAIRSDLVAGLNGASSLRDRRAEKVVRPPPTQRLSTKMEADFDFAVSTGTL